MRRSRYISTLLAGAAVLGVQGCDDKPEPTEAKIFPTVAACEREFTKEQCTEAFANTQQIHAQTAPRFDSLNACETEIGNGQCQVMPVARSDGTMTNMFVPAMMGFMLARALQPPMPGYGWGGATSYRYEPVYIDRSGYARSGANQIGQVPNGRAGLSQGGTTMRTTQTRSGEIGTRAVSRGGFGSTSARYSSGSGGS